MSSPGHSWPLSSCILIKDEYSGDHKHVAKGYDEKDPISNGSRALYDHISMCFGLREKRNHDDVLSKGIPL